jgi:hypothetical protein
MRPIVKAGLECPVCNERVAASAPLLRRGNRCDHCGSSLKVSIVYLRGLAILCMPCAFFLLWMTGVRNVLVFPLLWLATWLLIFCIALRVAPFVIPPTLVTDYPEYLTTLGIGPKSKRPTD